MQTVTLSFARDWRYVAKPGRRGKRSRQLKRLAHSRARAAWRDAIRTGREREVRPMTGWEVA